MYVKFASILNSHYGFAFDSDAWSANHVEVCQHFRMFETYNDGLCQHSGDWAVTREHLINFLASVATYLLAHPEDTDFLQRIEMKTCRAPSKKDLEFAASIIFKPGSEGSSYEKKTRYYSMRERKVTTNHDKQYDTRYTKVNDWCDGSAKAIFRIVLPDYADGLEVYAYAEAVRRWCYDLGEDGPPFYGLAAQFLEWKEFTDPDQARNLHRAFEAVRCLGESYRLHCSAATDLANILPPKPKEETESAA